MIKIIQILVIMFICVGCFGNSNKITDDSILGKWRGYSDNEHKMDIDFLDSVVIIDYKLGTRFVEKYFIINDTLFINDEEHSIIDLNKNTLELIPTYKDLRPDIDLIYVVTFRR